MAGAAHPSAFAARFGGVQATEHPAPTCGASFDDVVLPHLEAGHRLARWLIRSEADAEDLVQDALLRAFKYFRTFNGGNGRAWFLRIVRNTCTDRPGRERVLVEAFDEEAHGKRGSSATPETRLLQIDDAMLVARALRKLPERFQRLLVLREFEGLSYRELADESGVAIGTVMSRLSRARKALRDAIDKERNPDRGPAATALRDEEVAAVVA